MTTDYDKIASGFIDLLDEEEKSILAFGMIPHKKFRIFMKLFFDVYADKLTAEGGHYEGLEKDFILQNMKQEFKDREEHKVSVAIYRNAKMVV